MKIVVAALGTERRSFDLSDELWQGPAADGAEASSVRKVALSGKGVAHAESTLLIVDLEGTVAGVTDCARCGKEIGVDQDLPASLRYVPSPVASDDDEEVELASHDLDEGWYEGGAVQLADVVREAVVLALPTRFVCADREGCDKRTATLFDQEKTEHAGHAGFQALKDLF